MLYHPAESLVLTFQRPMSCSRVAGKHHGEPVTHNGSLSHGYQISRTTTANE